MSAVLRTRCRRRASPRGRMCSRRRTPPGSRGRRSSTSRLRRWRRLPKSRNDALDLRDVTLVGQSMGGWTCLEYALRRPERVRALVMASTSGTLDFNQLGDAGVWEWLRQAPGALAAMAARGVHPASGERMAREQPALAHLYWQIMEFADGTFREEVRQRLGELRMRPPALLAELSMPVLFITGDEDWVF